MAFSSVNDIDLSDIEFWARPEHEREEAFALLRREAPVHFFAERELPPLPKGPGFWALTTYEDVWHASRNPKLFCSGQGASSIVSLPVEFNEFFGSMIEMDDPKHARLRGIVQKAFTPRRIAQVEDYVRVVAASIVDDLIERFPEGECDFVTEVAAALPLQIICEMLGIPRSEWKRVFELTNVILGGGDEELVTSLQDLLDAGAAMAEIGTEVGRDRLANPRDDLATDLMHAELDGSRLTPQEYASFFILLAAAGNETTRTAISWGMKYLTDLPDQRQLWWNDFDGLARSAVEEIVRYSSPVIRFRRTATADTEIRGVPIKAGDKVVLYYNSANRDEAHFADPHRFDLTRWPNDQVGFGAGGPHFCLGANLARREIAVMFRELRDRLPDIAVTGEPVRLRSEFIHGIKRMPCAWTPPKR